MKIVVFICERQRDRETERQTDIDTQTQRYTDTERQRHTNTQTQRHTERQFFHRISRILLENYFTRKETTLR